MRAFIVFATLCVYVSVAHAGDVKYPSTGIPEALLKNAHIVKRYEEQRFEFISTKETVLYKKYAVTILDESGEDAAQFVEYYDQLRQVKSIEGSLYDKAGNLLRKLKAKEVQDFHYNSDNLVDDSRLKVHSFSYKEFPYTVEYEVEIRYNHSYYFEDWNPQDAERMAVQESKFIVTAPESYNVRYHALNYTGQPVVSTEKGKKIIMWQVKDVPAIQLPYAALWQDMTPTVKIAPTDFEIQGYKGVMNSWADYGKFQYTLNNNRDVLPEAIVQKVNELTKGVKEEKEKIRILYNFLQQNTRYISIQLGIGGWQPFEAAFVAQKGYGDCKALSNYMYSLLKAAGIKAYYTLVYAGESKEAKKMLFDLPSNQFNHVIICVPVQKDTMWLECTSQIETAGYMGGFTGNRKALMIDENGGTIVSTPKYGLKENTQVRKMKGVVDEAGNLKTSINTVYSALQQDGLHGMINGLSKEKVKKLLNEGLGLSNYEIIDFKYAESKCTIPQITEQLDVTVSNFSTVTGKRLFITPNLMNKSTTRLGDEERKVDFVFDMSYSDVDTVELEIPVGYTPESLPKDVAVKNKFGSYESSVKVLGNQIVYIRKREQYEGRFPASENKDLQLFYETIFKTDRSKIVLVKKEG